MLYPAPPPEPLPAYRQGFDDGKAEGARWGFQQGWQACWDMICGKGAPCKGGKGLSPAPPRCKKIGANK